MGIKRFHYSDILDETECVSCGAVHASPIYRSKADRLYWEFCDDYPENEKWPKSREYPERLDEGLIRETVVVENGFCKHCGRASAEFRFRGVFGWQAVKRKFTRKGNWETIHIPHASDRPHQLANQDKCGCKEDESRNYE